MHGIDINLAKWILRLQDRIVSLEAREEKRQTLKLYDTIASQMYCVTGERIWIIPVMMWLLTSLLITGLGI